MSLETRRGRCRPSSPSSPGHHIAVPYCTVHNNTPQRTTFPTVWVMLGLVCTSPPFPFLDQLVPGPGLSVLGHRRVFYGGLS